MTQLFSFRMVPAIGALLVERGVDPLPLVRDAGLPNEAITGEVTAPLARIRELVDRAAALLDQPLLGLELANLVQPGTFGIAEFVGRFAPTVQVGLETFCAAVPLVNPLIEWRYLPGKDDHAMQLSVAASRDGLGAQLGEYSVAVVLRLAGEGLDRPLALTRAWFAHHRGRGLAQQIEARLGCPVAFGDASSGFAFAAAQAARAPRMADAALFAFHLAQAKSRLATLGGDDVIAHVSRVIELRLPHGDVQLEAIASALAITERTLQRRLAEAGVSFRAVLAHVRRRRRAELERDGLAEPKIAELLGFSDVRAMRRSLV